MIRSIYLSSLLLSLALPVWAEPPSPPPPPPQDASVIEHPPELTPEARKALKEHCEKEPTACGEHPPEAVGKTPVSKPGKKPRS